MNNSPEGAQGSANSKTPLTDHLKYRLGLIAHDHEKATIIEAEVNERVEEALDPIFDMERQLAQSEEWVALLEGELAAILKSYNKAPNGISFARAFTDSHFYKVGLLLSSSKTN